MDIYSLDKTVIPFTGFNYVQLHWSTISPCMCNCCSSYKLFLSDAAFEENPMEEVTSTVMDSFSIPLMLLPVNLHVSHQDCVTPMNVQISLKILLNIKVHFADN